MMLQIAWWLLVIIIVGAILVGGVAGFFISRAWFKRYLEKNPPVNEAMIREMMRQMGRTPSEKQVRQILASMNQYKTTK
ncbi:MAG: YneF family protein [Acholeplasmataceae bacterium]